MKQRWGAHLPQDAAPRGSQSQEMALQKTFTHTAHEFHTDGRGAVRTPIPMREEGIWRTSWKEYTSINQDRSFVARGQVKDFQD